MIQVLTSLLVFQFCPNPYGFTKFYYSFIKLASFCIHELSLQIHSYEEAVSRFDFSHFLRLLQTNIYKLKFSLRVPRKHISRVTATQILNFDSKWRPVVNFTPRLLYPREKNSGTQQIKTLGGP
jgi:hypothetical protein